MVTFSHEGYSVNVPVDVKLVAVYGESSRVSIRESFGNDKPMGKLVKTINCYTQLTAVRFAQKFNVWNDTLHLGE